MLFKVYIYIFIKYIGQCWTNKGISYNLFPLASIVPIKLYRPDIYLIF